MSTFSVPDMTCGHCKAAVEKAIHQLDGAAAVSVDIEKRSVAVNSEKTTSDAILAALKTAGYEAEPTKD